MLFYWEQCIYYFSFLHRSVSDDFEVSSGVLFLEFGCSFVLITPLSQGWPCHPPFLFLGGWHGQSWLLGVCGTNEYTDAQVGDAGGLFESLDPVPCGAVPVHPV